MGVVLDTNVLIAALVAKGACSQVVEHCLVRHQVICSEFILDEVQDKLVAKLGYTPEESMEASGLFQTRVQVCEPIALDEPVCRAPDDDAILGTAIAGDAACIVTGDEDLLVLRRYRGVDIIRPAQFAEYESRTQA